MKFSTLAAAAVLATAAALTGCSKPPPAIVPAEGTLLINGQPLPGAFVQFVPTTDGIGSDYIASGTTDDQGRFQLTCKGQPGACACMNVVMVNEAPMPEKVRGNQNAEAKHQASLKNRPIPGRYYNTSNNPLKVEVTAGKSDYKLELTR